MRILIVEDDHVSREVLGHLLAPTGECALAEDGYKALELFGAALRRNTLFDLVCLDIMMPGITGREVLAAMRALEEEAGLPEERRAKVLMTTCVDDPVVVVDLFHLGCGGYLTKPIDRVRLFREVRRLGFEAHERQAPGSGSPEA